MKKWKPIVAITLLVVILAVICFIHFREPKLSQNQMDMIESCLRRSIIWNKNANGAETLATQYVGIYGDCVAFLEYVPSNDAIGQYIGPPYPIEYSFFKGVVNLHAPAYIIFYNLKEQRCQYAGGLSEPWLTEEQKEQLAQDIEKIGKKFS